MPLPSESRNQHPNTYFVQDHESQDEFTRLRIQDAMITAAMGGVLAEQANPASLRRVLDVGCGTGDWLIKTALEYPDIVLLIGVDVNSTTMEAARGLAAAAGVSNRVEFHTMDALRMLEFPTGYFDLVNQRAGMGFLRTWDWRKILQEYQRVARVDGVVRVTEFDIAPQSASPALTRLCNLFIQALYQAGNLFAPVSEGITNQLGELLTRYGLEDVQTRTSAREYRTGTAEWQGLYDDVRLGFHTFLPFIRKWIRVPDDYEEIYQQALSEMQHPDFVATGSVLTAWGKVPARTQGPTTSPR